jgi:hypothetical protein
MVMLMLMLVYSAIDHLAVLLFPQPLVLRPQVLIRLGGGHVHHGPEGIALGDVTWGMLHLGLLVLLVLLLLLLGVRGATGVLLHRLEILAIVVRRGAMWPGLREGLMLRLQRLLILLRLLPVLMDVLVHDALHFCREPQPRVLAHTFHFGSYPLTPDDPRVSGSSQAGVIWLSKAIHHFHHGLVYTLWPGAELGAGSKASGAL